VALEDAGEKTEAPTPRRRQEARERGQVARSADLTAAAALLGAMIILNFTAPAMFRNLIELARGLLGYQGPDAVLSGSTARFGRLAADVLARVAVPTCLAFMFVAVLAAMAQVGLIFTLHPLQPNLQKIDPISGLGRMFSLQSVVRLGIGILKIVLIGAVAFFTIKSWVAQIVNISGLNYWQIAGFAAELIFLLGVRLAIVLLVLAIFDYIYAKHRHEQSLRMTRQEVKEELRRLEGDPLVKERRRRVARQLAMQRMQFAVPNADVVITNPTELAVAIQYDPELMSAPKVTAKGAGYLAERIRQIAVRHGVPIVQRRPLAQALYKTVEIGQEIPPAFYKAVAEILAYVYELSGKSAVGGRSAAASA